LGDGFLNAICEWEQRTSLKTALKRQIRDIEGLNFKQVVNFASFRGVFGFKSHYLFDKDLFL
jgi:hypothetical protein